ncbi:3-oxosteroid 1-dehydrogenase [Sterolibacterium denitrificans]|uniref:3-oxosteroid 1-dehydrogenase n=2 Tax=Sterolibacterium denitrificans TaxID=157592 RepID=A0A656Z7Q3_9PROT|nr:FAD-dependent oxidoreductase [Sterolibacterium denitrificans]KYC29103.1 3-ketosteroid-delta-1-dehydrogenase [Sterolibacterium denitrificans]SMB21450.1 3-oxosteroid 1-dehydrogenase [Sterolibacterium denitrificans]
MSGETFDTDIVIVGSGAGGMTAALAAHEAGLRALIVEKTQYYGGSTARSGGGIWIPNNYLMQRAGVADSFEEARTYLQATVGERSPQASRDAYLTHAVDMIAWLGKETDVQCSYMLGYADYYPEKPGGKAEGRAVEPQLFDGKLLGEDLAFLRPPVIPTPAGLSFTAGEYKQLGLVKRTWQGKATALRIGLRLIAAHLSGKKMLMMGQALIGRLRLSLKKRGIPLWLDTPLQDLVIENGRVVGIEVLKDGQPLTIRATKGVVLAAGCFARNLEMRLKYQKQPITTEWTVASDGNTGDGIQAGMRIGAAIDLMDEAWWGPSSLPPNSPPFFHVAERGFPGLIMVNQKGQRFTNESASYVEVVQAMYRLHTPDNPHVPCWFIFDQRYRDNYVFASLFPGQKIPQEMLDSGYIRKADTLAELARQLNIEPAALTATVSKFNNSARQGEDVEFGRGQSAYDRYFGDPSVTPNANLAPIEQAPYYAVQVVAGDLGTKGGLVTDEFARVKTTDGRIIKGLYCVGNNSASVMGATYPGPGCTIGPAMAFGYIAARHAAGIERSAV